MRRSPLFAFLALATALALHGGCGSDGGALTDANSAGQPPTGAGGAFDPGQGGPSNCGAGASTGASTGAGASTGSGACGSGASSSGGSPPDGGMDAQDEPKPPMCAEAQRKCAHDFSLTAGAETSVEVRGDFAPGAWVKGVTMTKQGGAWRASVPVPWSTPVHYKFFVDGKTWVEDPANPMKEADGNGGFNSLLAPLTCDAFTCEVPAGTFDWRDAVLYFVFIDRFVNGDPSNDGAPVPGVMGPANYQGGDYKGLLGKIEESYFEGLGVNTLWLTVPMDNPDEPGLGTDGKQYSAYHGYWPSGLDKTESRFGSMAELKGVVDAAHKHGLKVLIDYAMNHVHKASPVYAQHPDWFWPVTYNGKSCVCGEGCSWDDAYEARRCWFRDYLPDFDFTKADARKFSIDNALFWAKELGLDGFRLDAVKHIEDVWVTELRTRLSAEIEPTTKEHFYLVGETFTGDRGLIRNYVDPFAKLDGQFDFPLRMQLAETLLMRKGSLQALDGFLSTNDAFYGAGIMSTFVGNHDIPRPIHFAEDTPMWGDPWADGKDRAWQNTPPLTSGTSAFERLAVAFTFLFTTKGVPLVYYGDEIGLPGAGDPDNRRMMTWTGYSPGQNSLLAHVKKLGQIRKDHVALRRGTRASLGATADTIAYELNGDGDRVIVALNRSDGDKQVSGIPSGSWTDLLSGATVSGGTVTVPARAALVLAAP